MGVAASIAHRYKADRGPPPDDTSSREGSSRPNGSPPPVPPPFNGPSCEGNRRPSRKRSSSVGKTPSSAPSQDANFGLPTALQKKNVKLHMKQCTNRDLQLFKTIREAYPFDSHHKRKSVRKKEQICGVLMDHRSKNWGEANITVISRPKEVVCILCDKILATAYNPHSLEDNPASSGAPFFCCKRCQSDDRWFNVCVNCYERGYLLVDDEKDLLQQQAEDVRRACAAKAIGTIGEMGKAFHKVELAANVFSGLWKGSFTENGHSRFEERELIFHQDGSVVGKDKASGIGLVGVSGSGNISWTERADWGVTKVEATLKARAKTICGTFTTSDGGKGTLELKAAVCE